MPGIISSPYFDPTITARSIPSVISWSVMAMADRPALTAVSTTSSGDRTPSE